MRCNHCQFYFRFNFRYDEVCLSGINFQKQKFDNAESFTQLVWKDTKRFGISVAKGKKDNQTCTYVAALYRPPGNIEEFYGENVALGDLKRGTYCKNLKRDAIGKKEKNKITQGI